MWMKERKKRESRSDGGKEMGSDADKDQTMDEEEEDWTLPSFYFS